MTQATNVLIVLGLLILWSGLFLTVSIMTLHDRDRTRRRRSEMAELQLRLETVAQLNSEVMKLAAERRIDLTPSPAQRPYREWWEFSKVLNPAATSRE